MTINLKQRLQISEAYKNWKPRSSPYDYGDWNKMLSPIEKELWEDMRLHGITMYPQFPVGHYYLDFADPERKICVEADGLEFHQDHEKDKKRDDFLKNLGWKVIRIPGFSIKRCDNLYISILHSLKIPRNDRVDIEFYKEQIDSQNNFV